MADEELNDRAVFEAALRKACDGLSLATTAGQVGQFWAHFELVLEGNKRFNLTRITEPADAAVRHYADSLSLLTWGRVHEPDISRIVDVGTGAGFPAVPLAIVRPDWRVTAIDATGKKADFVADVGRQMGLTNLQARKHRAGQDRPGKERYDLALFRAVGKLADSLRDARRLVRRGGLVVCYKSARVPDAEWSAAQRERKGSYRLADKLAVTLPDAGEELHRQLICFERT